MKIKNLIIFESIFILVCCLILVIGFSNKEETNINIVEINDISETLKENWNSFNEDILNALNYNFDYVVLDNKENVIFATRSDLNEDLNSAISNRDTIIDIIDNDVMLGKLIIYNNSSEVWQKYKMNILSFTVLSIILMGIITFMYSFYINNIILKPFNKLKDFAKHVAQGNLDIPLDMDKGNLFGAFTESFDLMREELKLARGNERKANQSKKELVASLSHDIKTPVASIKAVSEIMQAKIVDEGYRKQLEIINAKADQINNLITNMFNATLEELQELKVNIKEESSQLIYDLIKKADYNHQANINVKSECIVVMDSLRLSQVIDNIISNSYKYANTSINITIEIIDDFLEISFVDFGQGVPKDELPLIFNKFYRAKNSEGKSGTGLGLYISKYLMTKMQGDILCENIDGGFKIILKLRLA